MTVTDQGGGTAQQSATVLLIWQTADIALSPLKMDFGVAALGYTTPPAAQQLTITNNGSTAVDINTAALAGGSFAFTNFSSTNIAPNSSVTCSVAPVMGLAVGEYDSYVPVPTSVGGALFTPLFTVADRFCKVELTLTLDGKAYTGKRVSI